MAETRGVRVRLPIELESAARASDPLLAGLDMSTLVRVAVAALAGHAPREAIALVRLERGRGPKPRARAVDAA